MIYRIESRQLAFDNIPVSWSGWQFLGHVEMGDFSEGILRELCKSVTTKTKEVRYVRVPTISDWDEIKRMMR